VKKHQQLIIRIVSVLAIIWSLGFDYSIFYSKKQYYCRFIALPHAILWPIWGILPANITVKIVAFSFTICDF
jgi:hypothetical protein